LLISDFQLSIRNSSQIGISQQTINANELYTKADSEYVSYVRVDYTGAELIGIKQRDNHRECKLHSHKYYN